MKVTKIKQKLEKISYQFDFFKPVNIKTGKNTLFYFDILGGNLYYHNGMKFIARVKKYTQKYVK